MYTYVHVVGVLTDYQTSIIIMIHSRLKNVEFMKTIQPISFVPFLLLVPMLEEQDQPVLPSKKTKT